MSDQKPLLSICIPTYNRSKFLRVMLQALLPQVAECSDQVEVWVLDNASTDETKAIIDESRSHGPVKAMQNAENLGPLKNILLGPMEFARGEYVWVLGDHNLLHPGALRRILNTLVGNPEVSAFYANFQCADFPSQWPISALGGFDGSFKYVANTETSSGLRNRWSELLTFESRFCTQIYPHIVRTQVWRTFWTGRRTGLAYSSALTTFPHTVMLLSVLSTSRAYYIGSPVLTIFNGAQSWSDQRANVYLWGCSELVLLIKSSGMNAELVKSAISWQKHGVKGAMVSLLRTSRGKAFLPIIQYGLRYSLSLNAVRVIADAIVDSESFACVRLLVGMSRISRKTFSYLFIQCRPARWARKQLAHVLKDSPMT